MNNKNFNTNIKKLIRRGAYIENARDIFTKAQENKLIELVECQYIWGRDYPDSTNAQTQKMLSDLYFTLTGERIDE